MSHKGHDSLTRGLKPMANPLGRRSIATRRRTDHAKLGIEVFAELIFALILVGFTWQNVAYPTNIKSDENSKQTVQSGQQLSNSQRLASEAVDTFLKGVKLIDLPEGKAYLP